jgi:hypothetical protein
MRDGTVDGTARAFTVGDLRIDADLTRSAFLATDVGRDATVILPNEPWCSWSVDARIDGEHWNLALYFHGEQLRFVSVGGAFGLGPQWEPATEAARKEAHDAALARWGLTGPSVHSGIDPKEGSAGVTVVYRE